MAAGPQPPGRSRCRDQRQDSGNQDYGTDRCRSAADGQRRPAAGGSADLEDAHRLGNVLDPLLAQRAQPDGQARADLIAHGTGEANTARFCERLQSGGDVDAVAEQVWSFDEDVSEMDADTKPHLLAGRATLVFFFNGVLYRDGAFDGIDRTRKIGDKTVAGGIEDPAAMRGDQSIEDDPVGLQPPQRADLVQPHQPAVLGNIGREDHGKLPLDYLDFFHRLSSRGADAAAESLHRRI